MKKITLGIISDIHLEHSYWNLDIGEYPTVDLWIVAGDIDVVPLSRKFWIEETFKNKPVFTTMGNHDFWNNQGIKEDPYLYTNSMKLNGFKISGATLWTEIEDSPWSWQKYCNTMNDFRFTRGMTQDIYMNHHSTHRKFLFNSGADIIVSHHMPSFQFVNPKYKNSNLNEFFASELHYDFAELEKKPLVWIFGHTHSPTNKIVDGIHYTCNPRGYPGEENHWNYKPVILELIANR